MDLTADVISRPHSGYRHEAFLFADDEEFVAGAAPFVLAGAAAGEPTLVALPPARRELLQESLGSEATGVLFVDMTRVGSNPARLIPTLQAFLDAVGADAGAERPRPVRALGEPVWPGRRPAEVSECQLHEALLNMAIDPDAPVWIRCSYDVGHLPADVAETARHSHPVLVDANDYRGSTSYEGLQHVQTLLGTPLPEPTVPTTDLQVAADGLRAVRALVHAAASSGQLSAERAADFALAVHEVVRNSIRHGGGTGHLRTWVDPDAVVVEVRDAGRIEKPLAGRVAPDPYGEEGRGLWLAHQLADLVQIRSTGAGTTVRLSAWR
jgi:anti-sigma regulatory factor (Ser/Thr protein kinase)